MSGQLPSAELLSTILNITVTKPRYDILPNTLRYSHGILTKRINRYELTHLMKQWASSQKDVGSVDISIYKKYAEGELVGRCTDSDEYEYGCVLNATVANTEFEAIVKLCEWLNSRNKGT